MTPTDSRSLDVLQDTLDTGRRMRAWMELFGQPWDAVVDHLLSIAGRDPQQWQYAQDDVQGRCEMVLSYVTLSDFPCEWVEAAGTRYPEHVVQLMYPSDSLALPHG